MSLVFITYTLLLVANFMQINSSVDDLFQCGLKKRTKQQTTLLKKMTLAVSLEWGHMETAEQVIVQLSFGRKMAQVGGLVEILWQVDPLCPYGVLTYCCVKAEFKEGQENPISSLLPHHCHQTHRNTVYPV